MMVRLFFRKMNWKSLPGSDACTWNSPWSTQDYNRLSLQASWDCLKKNPGKRLLNLKQDSRAWRELRGILHNQLSCICGRPRKALVIWGLPQIRSEKSRSLNVYQETWFNEAFIAYLEGVFRCPEPLEWMSVSPEWGATPWLCSLETSGICIILCIVNHALGIFWLFLSFSNLLAA